MRRLLALLPPLMLAGGCAGGPDVAARLAHRPAEDIDPRVAIPSEERAGPVSPALASALARLEADAEAGDRAFAAAAGAARAAAAGAGRPQSESWIAAQQQLSALIAARSPVTRAMGDIDALGSEALVSKGYILAGDRRAVEAAAARVGAIDEREAQLVKALGARLGG